jgi:predicted signal transduction protein with EAL and GGDEF domain
VLIEREGPVIDTFAKLHALGIRLDLDDFGTGYSSLGYLHRFDLDGLKIDRPFVSNIGPDGERSEIVRTIVALANNLGMEVIAEGVETPDQLSVLQSVGCDLVQGYLFGGALSAEEMAERFSTGVLVQRSAGAPAAPPAIVATSARRPVDSRPGWPREAGRPSRASRGTPSPPASRPARARRQS